MSEDIPWRLRVFFSVDLIGSTAYKSGKTKVSKGDELSASWAEDIKGFLTDFPKRVKAAYSNLPELVDLPTEKLQVWKFSGDEILFCAELHGFRESLAHVCAFKAAVEDCNKGWSRKFPLKMKATGWLAGFPITNTDITLTLDNGISVQDYIGPSIDLGFRITKFATDHRFVVSADLAYFALESLPDDVLVCPCQLFFSGRELLKGANAGIPYPIVWIHMRDGVPTDEERLLGVTYEFNPQTLKRYLKVFLESEVESPGIRVPFIVNDTDGKFGEIPEDFNERIKFWKNVEPEREYDETVDTSVTADSEGTPLAKLQEPEAKEGIDPDDDKEAE